MLAPFLIMLREGVEAALITGIIATYLVRTGRREWLPAVWVGVFLAIAAALFVGAAIQLASAEFPQKAQELFEAIVGAAAVAILVSMVFWMRKAARSIASNLQGSIDAALADAHGGADGGASRNGALIAMVFFAVGREALESVFFLLAVFQQGEGGGPALGALLGTLLAAAIGFAIYAWGVRLNLRLFFRWTGIFILVVAAGLSASVLRNLHEAGLWNHLQTVVFDLSDALPMSSVAGAVLSGIFNYQAAPTLGEAIVYVAFLAVFLTLFLRPPPAASAPAAASATPAPRDANREGDAHVSA